MSKTILGCLVFLLASQAFAYDFQVIADRHILPAYHQLAEDSVRLDAATKAYCAAPTDPAMQELRGAYVLAFLAWQGAQHLRFGPIQYLSREHRFALWPDKRGTVGKHLARLLKDPALHADEFDISQKSVAVQGFSALDRLLYEDAKPDASDCRVIVAIGTNLRAMANELVHDWAAGDDPFVRYFARPGPENPVFESAPELAGQLLNALHTEIELITTQKLARPLGAGIEKARGKRAEGWRSGASLAAISANLIACRNLYQHAFAPELASGPLHRKMASQFEQALVTLNEIEEPLRQAVKDSTRRVHVERLQVELSTLRQLIARDLAGALNLSLGFNSLDGD